MACSRALQLIACILACSAVWQVLADDICTSTTPVSIENFCNATGLSGDDPAACPVITILEALIQGTQPIRCQADTCAGIEVPPHVDEKGTVLPQDLPDVRALFEGLPQTLDYKAFTSVEGATYYWYFRNLLTLNNWAPCPVLSAGQNYTDEGLPLPTGWKGVRMFDLPQPPNITTTLPFAVLLRPDPSSNRRRHESCKTWYASAAQQLTMQASIMQSGPTAGTKAQEPSMRAKVTTSAVREDPDRRRERFMWALTDGSKAQAGRDGDPSLKLVPVPNPSQSAKSTLGNKPTSPHHNPSSNAQQPRPSAKAPQQKQPTSPPNSAQHPTHKAPQPAAKPISPFLGHAPAHKAPRPHASAPQKQQPPSHKAPQPAAKPKDRAVGQKPAPAPPKHAQQPHQQANAPKQGAGGRNANKPGNKQRTGQGTDWFMHQAPPVDNVLDRQQQGFDVRFIPGGAEPQPYPDNGTWYDDASNFNPDRYVGGPGAPSRDADRRVGYKEPSGPGYDPNHYLNRPEAPARQPDGNAGYEEPYVQEPGYEPKYKPDADAGHPDEQYYWEHERYDEGQYGCGDGEQQTTSPHLVLLLRGSLSLSEWGLGEAANVTPFSVYPPRGGLWALADDRRPRSLLLALLPTDLAYNQVEALDYGPGKISAGYWFAAESIWAGGLKETILQEIEDGCSSVTLAGYSLGGAVAQLLAIKIEALLSASSGAPEGAYSNSAAPVTVVTFGAPNVGDSEWAGNFNKKINARNIAFQGDVFLNFPCAPTMIGCTAPPVTVPTNTPDGVWHYQRVGGEIIYPAAAMPFNDKYDPAQSWSTLLAFTGQQLCSPLFAQAVVASHTCSYLCMTSQYVGESNNLCWLNPNEAPPEGATSCSCFQPPPPLLVLP